MKKEVLMSFALLVIFSSIVKVQTKGTIGKSCHFLSLSGSRSLTLTDMRLLGLF